MARSELVENAFNIVKTATKLDLSFADDMTDFERVKTGMPMLDYVLGGGFPRNAITLIHGEASTGKTFITQKTIANAQLSDMVCGFIDVEHAYDKSWSTTIGIDNANLIVYEPYSAEEALDVAVAMCQSGEFDFVVVDSIAALLPAAEAEASMEDMQIGLQARLLNKFFRNVCTKNTKTALAMINQHRANVAGRAFHGIQPISLPGGKAQDFFTKVVIEMKRGQLIFKGARTGEPIGFTLRPKALKNKTAPPFRECDIPVYFNGEIDILGEIFDLALMYGIIVRGGPYYSYGDLKIQGRDGFIRTLEENGLSEQLEADVEERISNQSGE